MTIGQRILRREDPRLLAGHGRYVADLSPADALHAAFVRSPYAHARIVEIDTADAKSMPGVVAVLTADDLPRSALSNARHPGLVATEQPVLAHERVRFVGESVAIVIARDRYVAEDAAEAVAVEFDPLEVAIHADQEPGPDAWLFDHIPRNLIFHERQVFGQPDDAFSSAAHVVTRRLRFNRQSATPMETRGCIARFDHLDGRLSFWASTQSPHSLRRKLARATGVAEHRITVHVDDVGGAFGQKIPIHPEEVCVALAAIRLGATITWIEDRRENLLAAPHSRGQIITVDLALDEDGRFLAISADLIGDSGAYSFNAGTALTEPYLSARSMLGPYRIDHYRFDASARLTNKSPVAPYRGVGFVSSQAVRELVIDDAARLLDWDRVDLRRRNLVRSTDFPYTNAVGMVYDSGSYVDCLDAVTTAVGTHLTAGTAPPPGTRIGVGYSPFVEPTAPGSKLVEQVWGTPSLEGDSARVVLDTGANATVSFGTPSQGQGIETTIAQIVSSVLDLPFSDVTVSFGDTTRSPQSMTGTRGSRTAVISGGAAAAAAAEVRDQLLRVASVLLESAPEDLVIVDRRIHVAGSEGSGVALDEVVRAGLTSPQVRSMLPDVTFDVVKSFDPPGATYSNGCVGVVVEVDEVTGKVTPRHVVIAHDCGTVINHAVVDGQIVGAFVQGLGTALLEHLPYSEDGQPMATTLMDYLLPTTTETTDVELVHFCSPSPHTWAGVKGAGEAGTIGGTAAVICAVADAAGEQARLIDQLPLRPPAVSELFSEV